MKLSRLIGFGLVSSVLLVAVVIFVGLGKIKFISSEEFNSSVSSLISIEGSDEYVVATLRTSEALSKQVFKKALFDLPIGDTEASISVDATYKYFVRLSGVEHRLIDETLYIDVPDLELLLPVAFDIQTLAERSETTGFGPNEEALKRELREEMAAELRFKGRAQKRSMYETAAKAIANNFNSYMAHNGLSGMYRAIEVSFDNVSNQAEVNRRFNYSTAGCEGFPCDVNVRFGNYHIFLSR